MPPSVLSNRHNQVTDCSVSNIGAVLALVNRKQGTSSNNVGCAQPRSPDFSLECTPVPPPISSALTAAWHWPCVPAAGNAQPLKHGCIGGMKSAARPITSRIRRLQRKNWPGGQRPSPCRLKYPLSTPCSKPLHRAQACSPRPRLTCGCHRYMPCLTCALRLAGWMKPH